MSLIKNTKGLKFGRLFVQRRSPKRYKGQARWICQCDCGNTIVVTGTSLRNGMTKSCGCLRIEKAKIRSNKIGKEHYAWTGYGDISGAVFSGIMNCAKERKIPFDLNIQALWKLFLKQNRKCAISGVELTFKPQKRSRDGTTSLDRIDSSKGYTIDNVQWVHKQINFMKQSLPQSEFLQWINIIAQYQNNH